MIIYPSINLLEGRVVRFSQGDYSAGEFYDDAPEAFATRFAKEGARHLNLLDLDGIKQGYMQNFGALQRVMKAQPKLFVEFGGGICDEEIVKRCFDAGVKRVLLGTTALRNPKFTQRMVAQYGAAISLVVNSRDGRIDAEGWLSTPEIDVFTFCREMSEMGVSHVTHINALGKGEQREANIYLYKQLSTIKDLKITAAGGVSTIEDVRALSEMNLYGAVVGKAIYTGAVPLRQAIEIAKRKQV